MELVMHRTPDQQPKKGDQKRQPETMGGRRREVSGPCQRDKKESRKEEKRAAKKLNQSTEGNIRRSNAVEPSGNALTNFPGRVRWKLRTGIEAAASI